MNLGFSQKFPQKISLSVSQKTPVSTKFPKSPKAKKSVGNFVRVNPQNIPSLNQTPHPPKKNGNLVGQQA